MNYELSFKRWIKEHYPTAEIFKIASVGKPDFCVIVKDAVKLVEVKGRQGGLKPTFALFREAQKQF